MLYYYSRVKGYILKKELLILVPTVSVFIKAVLWFEFEIGNG